MDRKKVIFYLSVIVLMLIVNELTKYKYPEPKVLKKTIDKKKVKFVNYNTTWCYWSKKLQPTWEKLEQNAMNDETIEIVDVKCDLKENEELCKKEQIEGFPTMKLYVDDEVVDYKGDRSLEDIQHFIENHQ